MATYTTGGNLPAEPQIYTTGGNLPPVPLSSVTPPKTINGQNYVATTGPSQPGTVASPVNLVTGINNQIPNATLPTATTTTLNSLDQILSADNPYMRNARTRGLEVAGSRGLLNSSIAAGAAQRSAIEASMPILNQSMGLNNQRENQTFQQIQQTRDQAFDLSKTREQNAFTGQQNALDRTQSVNSAILAAELRRNDTLQQGQVQNWLNNETFTRQFNGNLAMLPITTAADLTAAITQLAMTDPELYTPTVVSGMTQFFTKNMQSILQQYFPTVGGTG